MKMISRTRLLLALIGVILSAVPVYASDVIVEVDNLKFKGSLDFDLIHGYFVEKFRVVGVVNKEEAVEVVIPSTVDYAGIAAPVTSIGSEAFYGCSSLTSVEIPNSVTSIDEKAFLRCSSLTSIEIPNSVTTIDDKAFSGCSGLKKFTISDGTKNLRFWSYVFYETSIETLYLGRNLTCSSSHSSSYPFYKKSTLKELTIGNSVTSIGSKAFFGCSGLTSVEIPNSVTSIGESAFEGCSGLTSVEIPNSVTSIGESAFRDCSGLTSVEIPNSVTSIGASTFESCIGLTSVEIPNSVTSIGESAFEGCSGLTSVEIPNSVKKIGNSAFYGCSSLSLVESLSTTPPDVTTTSFDSTIYSTCELKVPEESVEAYRNAYVWKKFQSIVPTGIDGVETDAQVSVAARDGVITVTAPEGAEVEVYSMTGMRMAKTREHRIEGLAGGVYIVRVGGKSFKVML